MIKLSPNDLGCVLSVLFVYGCEQLMYIQMSDIMSSEMISNLVHSFKNTHQPYYCAKYSEEV